MPAAGGRERLPKTIDRLGGGEKTSADKARLVDSLRHAFTLSELLNCSGLPRSTYHYHHARAGKPGRYTFERQALTRIFHENRGRYGYRRIAFALRCEEGLALSGKTVLKLMHEQGLHCLIRRKRYHSYRGEVGEVAPHLLSRDFAADRPGVKWVTDITEFKVGAAKLYLSPAIDLFNGEVISYSVSSSPGLRLVLNTVEGALRRLGPGETPILHSDQGWQYQHPRYRRLLGLNGITQSMSRKGNCLDNACAESFFGLLKSEFYHGRSFEDAKTFRVELDDYIEYYNNRRIKLKLKGLSPVEYRTQSQSIA